MHVSEPITKNLNEDRPILSAAKCSSMTLLSGNLRFMRIFVGVHWGGASNDSRDVDNGNFQCFRWLFTLEIRPALLYSDTASTSSAFSGPKMHDLE